MKQENTIQVFVHHSLLQNFGDQIAEGNIIEICDFSVQSANKKTYKVSSHQSFIRATERTKIKSLTQSFCQIPLEKFRFRSYEDFVQLQYKTVDLYGIYFCFYANI